MKLLMIIVLVAACTYVGYGFSRHYVLRLDFFNSLLQFFNKMNLDINFSREKLTPILEKFESPSKELALLLKNFLSAIEEKNLIEKKLFDGLKLLNEEEKQLLFAFFRSVGHFDLSGQTHQLNNYTKQFEHKQKLAQEEKNKYAPLFTKLGLIIGVVISLILISAFKEECEMNVDIILKIAAVGILTAIVNQILKHTGKDEIATITTLAGLIITLFMVIDMISSLFAAVRTLFNI